jgi:acylphosphatase
MSTVRAHVFVSGRVQGVGYRASCERAASGLVTGWVRNGPDDRVEAVFEGEKESVEKVLAWCRRGPPAARVTDVAVVWETPQGEREFRITY